MAYDLKLGSLLVVYNDSSLLTWKLDDNVRHIATVKWERWINNSMCNINIIGTFLFMKIYIMIYFMYLFGSLGLTNMGRHTKTVSWLALWIFNLFAGNYREISILLSRSAHPVHISAPLCYVIKYRNTYIYI